MSKFTVLGPSDSTKLSRYTKIKDYSTWIQELAEICAEYFDELLFIPDHGTYVDLAREFLRIRGPAAVTAVLPSDAEWLVERAQSMGVSKIHRLERGAGWTYLNTHFTGLAPYSVCIGYSAGSLLEMAASKYLRLYEHQQTTFFIDERAISTRLPLEVEEDIGTVQYFNDPAQLNRMLHEIA